MAAGTVCHIEIDSTNMDQSQAFYEKLFGWNFREFMGGAMRVFGLGETHIGGLMKVDHVNPGNSPSIWIEVDDIDRCLQMVESLAGTVANPKSEVPGVGFSAQFKDLDQNLIGIVQFG